MTEPVTRDLVDRTELRRRLAECGYGKESLSIRMTDAMPSVECPRGWTRDEVRHELDTHPGAVCEVRRYDVRVVLPEPVTVWVPLTKLVGRTIKGCRWPVAVPPIYDTDGDRWVWSSTGSIERFPDGTLNLETGMVEVLAEGDA